MRKMRRGKEGLCVGSMFNGGEEGAYASCSNAGAARRGRERGNAGGWSVVGARSNGCPHGERNDHHGARIALPSGSCHALAGVAPCRLHTCRGGHTNTTQHTQTRARECKEQG